MRIARILCAGVALSLAVSAMPRMAQGQVAANRALSGSVKELTVDAISLQKTLDFLRDCSSANIVVNWKTLEAAGVTKDTPITLSVKELPLRKMMQLVLDQASPNAQLVYTVQDNVITITTQDDADKHMVTKVYMVDDLILPPNTKQAPNISATLTTSTNGQGQGQSQGGIGGGSGPFGGPGGTGGTGSGTIFNPTGGTGGTGTPGRTATGTGTAGGAQQGPAQQKQQAGNDLVTLIQTVIRPTIWSVNGGPATAKFTLGKLIVTAPISVQEAIGGPVNTGIRYGN